MTTRAMVSGFALAAALAAGLHARAAAQHDEADRVREAATVLSEIAGAPDKGIPSAVFDKAEAIVAFPSVITAGFVVGGHRGRGVISALDRDRGVWSPPAFLTITGGSVGLQVGAEAADVVLVVMNRRGLERLIANQFKIGADGSVAAGPVGRRAEASTDLQMRAEILSYSRARGVFAGLTIQGSVIKADVDANDRFYGRRLATREIVLDGKVTASPAAATEVWLSALRRFVH